MKKGFIKNLLSDYKFFRVEEISQEFFSGAKLIIFDIDNTLFFSETTNIKKETLEWFFQINKKYNCICLSNSSTINKRKERISELLGCEIFLSHRKKPSKRLFEEVRKKFKLNKNDKIFVVGDRTFTDVLFGNRSGAATILVDPLSRKNEDLSIKMIRFLERFILLFLKYF